MKDAAMLPNPKRAITGRPSIYKPEYCGLIEQWGKEGKSQSEMCSLLNIGRATFHGWTSENEAFAASALRAREHAQAWWERKAQQSLPKKHFQAQLWRYSMMGRFKDDYAEQKTDNVGGFDLGSFVGAIAQAGAKVALASQQGQPGDGAKVINPLDDVVAVPNKDR